MKPLPTVIAIFVILSCAAGGIYALKKFMPVAKKAEREKVVVGIEVIDVKTEDVKVKIHAQGLVEPVVETMAISEVAGQVKSVAPNFEAGATFKTGDVLLELDDTDYQAALSMAKADAATAKLDLELEISRKAQAERDWKDLGGDREQSELAKREPQIEAAEARVAAATKAVEKAMKDIERTKLVALYDGRVRNKSTSIGSYVTPGARIAELYGTKSYEVRLPVSLDEFSLVDVHAPGENVKLKTKVGSEEQVWTATLLRSEGEIDRASRSVFLVAGLTKEGGFSQEDVMGPNLFVEAEIEGRTLKNVVRVPRKAFVDTDTVLVLSKDYRLNFRKVEVDYETPQELYVSAGLKDGERICVTALAAVVENMEVRVIGEETEGSAERVQPVEQGEDPALGAAP